MAYTVDEFTKLNLTDVPTNNQPADAYNYYEHLAALMQRSLLPWNRHLRSKTRR